jgi:hypothetical protein
MTFTYRTFSLPTLLVGFALANGCGRTGMDQLASGSDTAGKATAGQTGSESGGAGGSASGLCGEALCLTSLFQTCVPEGSCSVQGGGSPSAVFSDACYSNGVTVFFLGTYNGPNGIRNLDVRRNGTLCYSIDELTQPSGAVSYVFNGANNQQVATGSADSGAGPVTVTCTDGKSATVSDACMNPTGDSSRCGSGTCP